MFLVDNLYSNLYLSVAQDTPLLYQQGILCNAQIQCVTMFPMDILCIYYLSDSIQHHTLNTLMPLS